MGLEAKLLGRDKVAYTSAGIAARESKLSTQFFYQMCTYLSTHNFWWRIRKAHRHQGTHKVNISGGDALRGHTRSHPEHDG